VEVTLFVIELYELLKNEFEIPPPEASLEEKVINVDVA